MSSSDKDAVRLANLLVENIKLLQQVIDQPGPGLDFVSACDLSKLVDAARNFERRQILNQATTKKTEQASRFPDEPVTKPQKIPKPKARYKEKSTPPLDERQECEYAESHKPATRKKPQTNQSKRRKLRRSWKDDA